MGFTYPSTFNPLTLFYPFFQVNRVNGRSDCFRDRTKTTAVTNLLPSFFLFL